MTRLMLAAGALVVMFGLLQGQQDTKKGDSKKDDSAKDAKKADSKQEQVSKLRIEVTGGDDPKPVEGAEVTVALAGAEKPFSRVVFTKADGVALIADVPRGRFSIQVLSPSWKTEGTFVEVNQAEKTVTLRLKKQ